MAAAGRTEDAVALCLDLVDGGVPAPVVTARLVRLAPQQVGRRAQGPGTIARLHAATAVADACLGVLASAAPATPGGAPIVVAGPADEWHCLAARMVTELLRWRGVAAEYAGTLASAEALDEALRARRPRALALSCSTAAALPGVASAVAVAAEHRVPVIGGGAGFGHQGRYASAVGVTAWAHGPREAVRRLALWARHPPVPAGPPPEPIAYRRLQRHRDALVEEVTAVLLAGRTGPGAAGIAVDTARHAVALALAATRTGRPAILDAGLTATAASLARHAGQPDLGPRLGPALRQALGPHGSRPLVQGLTDAAQALAPPPYRLAALN